MRSRSKPGRITALVLLCMLCVALPVGHGFCEEDIINFASYITYDTTYDDILKMYLRVMPAQCRGQSRRRHDLYNDFMYDELSPYYMEGMSAPEYEMLDADGKAAKKKELQEKTLQYMKREVGYAIRDINGDGIDELIIGRDRSYIYELFTMDDGKVRELVKAGYRNSCNLLNDGGLKWYTLFGGSQSGDLLFQMNGTKKVKFIKGYFFNGQVGHDNHLDPDDCWFRITNAKNISNNTMDQHVPSSEAEAWIAECRSRYANIRFIPFSAYEKGISGDGIAILSVKGKTSGTQKVRIRSKPDKKSKILAQKSVGTYVKATGMEGDYYQITIGKKTGYVHKDYITIVTDLPEESGQE